MFLATASRVAQRQAPSAEALYRAVAAMLIVAALIVALRNTRDLRGPFDPDLFRDLAQAQTARDGHLLSDPYYRGEWAWYNPLLAWTVATLSVTSGRGVEDVHIHGGPWLTLLGPIAFFLLASRIAGSQAGLSALTLYLFFIAGNEHSWASATYSPWLFADNFSEGLFFSTGLVMMWADRKLTTIRALAAGIMMGITFLAHAAPATILAGIACVLWWRRWQMLAIAGGAAIMSASPFLAVILVHYRFHVIHAAPLAYEYPPISKMGIVQTLRNNQAVIAGSLGGMWAVRSRFAWAWLLIALGLTLYAMSPLHPLLPAFHFWLYVTAVFALLAGAFLARLCPNPYVFCALTVCAVVWYWPTYVERNDLTVERALAMTRKAEHIEAAQFLRTVTAPDDVVLGNRGVVSLVIGPAARKTVAPEPFFANPYVEYESRRRDREEMLAAIDRGDEATFSSIAKGRSVSAVVLNDPKTCVSAGRMFPLTWQLNGGLCVSLLTEKGTTGTGK